MSLSLFRQGYLTIKGLEEAKKKKKTRGGGGNIPLAMDLYDRRKRKEETIYIYLMHHLPSPIHLFEPTKHFPPGCHANGSRKTWRLSAYYNISEGNICSAINVLSLQTLTNCQ